ncbi:MAG: thioredoxin domain-containing protein [Gemmatimonadetes bacterium]|nr:thioredoxin domain-containing protein [Gemmatimonadota bacterium]
MGILRRAGRGLGFAALGLGFAATTAAAQVDLSEVGHLLGDPDAPVTVVEFSDFACSACAEFAGDSFGELRVKLIESGRVVWRQVPFALGFRRGEEATYAGECAADQGAFWPMHDALFADPERWKRARDLDGAFIEIARAIGLEVDRFTECIDDREPEGRIDAANRAARDLGIRATPAFYIAGRPALGALSVEHFVALVEAAETERGGG